MSVVFIRIINHLVIWSLNIVSMFFVLVQCLGLGPVLVNEVQVPLIISRAALWPDKKAPCTVAALTVKE